MIYEIKNRFTDAVVYAAEIDCDENATDAIKLRLAVVAAINAGANLSRANLSRADLSEANLSGANLRWANLSEANLRWADLSRANLNQANLSRANLSRANLSEANLSGANLRWANLSGANLLSHGDMKYLRTMQVDAWAIGYTHDTLQIGCQRHEIEKWRRWDTEAGRKWISAMDDKALEWADRNLALVLAVIDANPALVPDLGKAGE